MMVQTILKNTNFFSNALTDLKIDANSIKSFKYIALFFRNK